MPYVPAHTNEVGSFVRARSFSGQVWNANGFTFGPSTYSVSDTFSYKSITVDGQYHSTFRSFRRATPYTRCVQKIEDASGGYDFWTTSNGANYQRHAGTFGAVSGYPFFPIAGPVTAQGGVGVSQNTINRATTEALVKLQNMKLNLGVALGEITTTVRMIQRSFVKIVKVVSALLRGNPALAWYHLFGNNLRPLTDGKSASELWLEWQYGWQPLITDIYGGIELANTGFREKHLLFNVSRTITMPLDPALFFSSGVGVTSGTAYESSKVELWGVVTASELHSANSLGLINPLSLGWELLTLSFVVDWLIPVGTWLESLGASIGITFVDGHRTDKIYADVTGGPLYPGTAFPSTSARKGNLPRARNRVLGMRRVIYNSWPWALPYWKNPFSQSHVTSAAALLRTFRR